MRDIVEAQTPIELINSVYATLDERISKARAHLKRPLTLAEKILVNHLDVQNINSHLDAKHINSSGRKTTETKLATGRFLFPERKVTYTDLRPDRVAMQDATAQMAWLQFMNAGLDRVQVPVTVHCDHLIQARTDAKRDLLAALSGHEEVFDFLRTVSARYGAGFWKPGSGIIHQVVLEHYAFPGGLMIGTDSHTPNAGGLAMLAIGVGGADAVDVMSGWPWNLLWPGMIGVKLTGELNGWAAPKDVILKAAEILTVSGGTDSIVEYFGAGAETLSATGKATICNMGAEIGATTSVFSYDEAIARYLRHTNRADTAEAADAVAHHLRSDPEVHENPERFYDRVIEIDLSTLTPSINGPHTPDLSRSLETLKDEAAENGWPERISAALIGSCTNSSYEDITRTASIARDALSKNLKARTKLLVTPGSEQVRATIERDGLIADLEALGATVLANACGPCIGQWDRSDDPGYTPGEPNVIVTSYNRNFPERNDGDAATLAFVASPETVLAMALTGSLTSNPITGPIVNENGDEVYLEQPSGLELPPDGFEQGVDKFIAPTAMTTAPATTSTPSVQPTAAAPTSAPTSTAPMNAATEQVYISPSSERLQILEPFLAWDGKDYTDLPIIAKAAGKCTTDHISPAGPWLQYRGHLENISGNLYSGVVNSYSSASHSDDNRTGHGKNHLTGAWEPLPKIAADYHKVGVRWAFIGGYNTGEGSSREHAAMEPRFRGCVLVLAISFARIHETNLKKQGVLPLTFADAAHYHRIGEDDRLNVRGLADLTPDVPVKVEVVTTEGKMWSFAAVHTLSYDQIEWFQAGSAMNLIRKRASVCTA